MSNVLINILVQMFYFVGSVFLAGFLISQLSRVFYRMFASKTLCYVLGVIGTPIHELSHALMCLIFGHKIEEMKLFQVDENDDKLGYVVHSYNKRNPYHQIGNYFIGVAPILVGTVVICLLMYFMLPNAFGEIKGYIDDVIKMSSDGFSFAIFGAAFGIIKSIFANITAGIIWFVFVVIVICISMHMSLSGADIKGSLLAIPLIAVILAVANFVVSFISDSAYSGFVAAMNVGGAYLMSVLFLALLFAVFVVLIALVFKVVISIFKR